MTKHNHIDTLSEELLLHIFRDLRSSSTAGALLPSLLLCRRFNRIGTPLLYQDVVIRNPSLRVSIASLITHGHEVRSLSIRIRPCEIEMYTPAGQQDYIRVPVGDPHKLASEGSGPTQALWKALDAFSSAVIPRLRHLFTFSLTLEHTLGEGLPPGFWIHPRSLLPILRNLPLSVENLEVDLAFSEHPFIHDNPTIHICPVLRPLLPQLRHLRLRLECLCPALFYDVGANEAVKAPQLETLGINTSVATRYTVPCGMPRLDTGVGYGLNIADCPNNPSYYWPALCLTVLEGGSFPRVQRFDVFNFEMDYSTSDDEEDSEDGEDSEEPLSPSALRACYFIQHSIPARKTYRLPMKHVCSGVAGLMLRTRSHEELFGDLYSLEQRVEGPAWVETVEGMRYPAAFANTQDGKGYLWRKLVWKSREEWSRHEGKGYGLEVWGEEERVGSWLLKAEEVDGV